MKTLFVDFYIKHDISTVFQDISNLIEYRYKSKPNSLEFGQKLDSSCSKNKIGFHDVILQPDGSHADDLNYPGFQLEILFEELWDAPPSGEFYDAYKLVKSFRDGMQKALWVNKGNQNTFELRNALHQMTLDPDAVAAIEAKVGKYEWKIGADGDAHRDAVIFNVGLGFSWL